MSRASGDFSKGKIFEITNDHNMMYVLVQLVIR